jgi:hypothetical protein
VAQAQQYLAGGYRWVVDVDLEKFFDRVNHDKLLGELAKRITDKRILRLIGAYLKAGVMENAVEAGQEAICRTAKTRRGQRSGGTNRWQRSWSVATREQPGAQHCFAEYLLWIAWSSDVSELWIAQCAELPCTDSYARWCDRDSGRPLTYVD